MVIRWVIQRCHSICRACVEYMYGSPCFYKRDFILCFMLRNAQVCFRKEKSFYSVLAFHECLGLLSQRLKVLFFTYCYGIYRLLIRRKQTRIYQMLLFSRMLGFIFTSYKVFILCLLIVKERQFRARRKTKLINL